LLATSRQTLVPETIKIETPWVLLIDEIDKADPDVPNNLLVPLGSLEFAIPELGMVVRAKPSRLPLVLITTNEERELPPAFLRRCIELVIGEPDAARLERVAIEHKLDKDLDIDLPELAECYMRAPRPNDQRRNVAEFLDFVRAWRELELSGDEATRDAVLEAISGRAST
jgi:MoxR-like ATPase